MFEEFRYFQNEIRLWMKMKKISLTTFEENWELSSRLQVKISDQARVNPYYIVVVSYPDDIKLDELELALPIRGYVAAKHTSRESSRRCQPLGDFQVDKSVLSRICRGQEKSARQRWRFYYARGVGNSEIFRCAWKLMMGPSKHSLDCWPGPCSQRKPPSVICCKWEGVPWGLRQNDHAVTSVTFMFVLMQTKRSEAAVSSGSPFFVWVSGVCGLVATEPLGIARCDTPGTNLQTNKRKQSIWSALALRQYHLYRENSMLRKWSLMTTME